MLLSKNQKGIAGKTTLVTVVIVIVVLIGVSILLFNSAKPPVYSVDSNDFTISAMYGQTIRISDISDIRIDNGLPDGLWKKSGSDFGSKLKGTFGSSIGDVSLYVDKKIPPFIYITTVSGKTVILNDQSESKTRELFDKLTSAKN